MVCCVAARLYIWTNGTVVLSTKREENIDGQVVAAESATGTTLYRRARATLGGATPHTAAPRLRLQLAIHASVLRDAEALHRCCCSCIPSVFAESPKEQRDKREDTGSTDRPLAPTRLVLYQRSRSGAQNGCAPLPLTTLCERRHHTDAQPQQQRHSSVSACTPARHRQCPCWPP